MTQKPSSNVISVLILSFVVCFTVSRVGYAAQFNNASVQGLVSDNSPDCVGFCPSTTGCLLEMGTNGDTGGDPFIVAVGPSPDCSIITPGTCLQVSGEVVDILLPSGLAYGHVNLAGHSWSIKTSADCAP